LLAPGAVTERPPGDNRQFGSRALKLALSGHIKAKKGRTMHIQ